MSDRMSSPHEYDPRIAMDPSYVRFQRPPRRRRGRRALLVALAVPVVLVLIVAGTGLLLGRDPRLPAIERLADYRPEVIARLYARTGELVADSDGVRRVPLVGDIPPRVASAVIARWEPGFLERPPLGQRDLARALLAQLRGTQRPPPLSLLAARSLVRTLPDRGPVRLVKEWIVALRLERHLTRAEILRLFLDEVPFGAGRFGVEEAARVTYGKPAAALGDAEAKALADLAGDESGPAVRSPAPDAAAGCGAEALRTVAARMTDDALRHFAGRIVTPCEPALTKLVEAALERQRLARAGLTAAVAVLRMPADEVAVLVGPVETARALGVVRAPLVLGAVLAERKRTAASKVGTGSLRSVAAQSPVAAADALVAAGLDRRELQALAARAGLPQAAAADALVDGTAMASPLAVASFLAMFAANGLHRLPQLLLSVGDAPEPEGVRAQLPALDAAAAYIVTSLLQLPASVRERLARPVAGVMGGDGKSAWFGAYGPDLVVVVWVGADGATPGKGADPARLAGAIGTDVFLAATRGRPARPFARPSALLVRRVDASGALLPRSSTAGMEEWFVPGSLPPEPYELPPEDAPLRRPSRDDE